MALIKDKDAKAVQERLAKLTGLVTLAVFTQEFECDMCRETRELAQEVSALSGGKVKVDVHDLVRDKAKADSLRVDKIPAIAVSARAARTGGSASTASPRATSSSRCWRR